MNERREWWINCEHMPSGLVMEEPTEGCIHVREVLPGDELEQLERKHAALVAAARGCIANEQAGINVVGSGSWAALRAALEKEQ